MNRKIVMSVAIGVGAAAVGIGALAASAAGDQTRWSARLMKSSGLEGYIARLPWKKHKDD